MNKVSTVKDLTYFLTQFLESTETGKITHPRQEADQIVSHLLNCKREDIYLVFDQTISKKTKDSAFDLLLRRLSGEPLSYLLKKKFFYKHDFFIDSNTLIPRPETEEIVKASFEWFQSFLNKNKHKKLIRILDIGTGSGCIGLSLLKEIKNSFLVGLDISKKALKIAKQNAKALGLEKRCLWINKKAEEIHPSLFPSFLNAKFDCIVSNPPYIDEKLKMNFNQEAKNEKNQFIEKSVLQFEPHEALFAPQNGMKYLISWSKMAFKFLDTHSFFAIEVGNDIQMTHLQKEFKKNSSFYKVFIKKDFSQKKRVLCAIKEKFKKY